MFSELKRGEQILFWKTFVTKEKFVSSSFFNQIVVTVCLCVWLHPTVHNLLLVRGGHRLPLLTSGSHDYTTGIWTSSWLPSCDHWLLFSNGGLTGPHALTAGETWPCSPLVYHPHSVTWALMTKWEPSAWMRTVKLPIIPFGSSGQWHMVLLTRAEPQWPPLSRCCLSPSSYFWDIQIICMGECSWRCIDLIKTSLCVRFDLLKDS